MGLDSVKTEGRSDLVSPCPEASEECLWQWQRAAERTSDSFPSEGCTGHV